VLEAPKRLDRLGELLIGAGLENLEDVTVVLLVGAAQTVGRPGLAGGGEVLLAGQPVPPRRGAAGAVANGAREADPFAGAVAATIGGQHGAAAGVHGTGVVDGTGDVGHAEGHGVRGQLVVLDERDPVSSGPDDGGAVVEVGRLTLIEREVVSPARLAIV
jgi:hypothetical protein